MAISSTGLGSGLNVESIITQLMTLEKRPLDILKQKDQVDQARLSAFGQVKSQFDNLKATAASVATASSWQAVSATLGNTAVASAIAVAGATPGTYAIEVTNLAQAHTLASAAYAASTTVVGTGTLNIDIGTYSAGVFTPNAGTTTKTAAITVSNNTLAGVRDAINAANAGVTASIVTDASGARLAVTSNATGATNSVRMTVTNDGDANDTDTSGLSALAFNPAAAINNGKNLTSAQAALDANLKISGITIASASNTLTGALDGVTLTLTGTNAGAPTTLTIANNRTALTQMAQQFVTNYNNTVKTLSDLTKADPNGKATGILQADATARSLKSSLQGLLHQPVTGITTPYTTLSDVGITAQKDGTLTLDSAKFTAALDSGIDKVAALFTTTGSSTDPKTQGIALRVSNTIGNALSSIVDSRSLGIQTSLKSRSKSEIALNNRLALVEQRLRNQYLALDKQMNQLNGLQQALTQMLTQLSANSTNRN